jgi:hypothetical protein
MSHFQVPDTSQSLGMLLAESRVLSAVAGDTMLEGTADELIRGLGVGRDVFRVAVQDLVDGGWIFAMTTDDGRLTIGRERRMRNAGPPNARERRRPASLWEGLDPR